jgi:hypothetical protein
MHQLSSLPLLNCKKQVNAKQQQKTNVKQNGCDVEGS